MPSNSTWHKITYMATHINPSFRLTDRSSKKTLWWLELSLHQSAVFQPTTVAQETPGSQHMPLQTSNPQLFQTSKKQGTSPGICAHGPGKVCTIQDHDRQLALNMMHQRARKGCKTTFKICGSLWSAIPDHSKIIIIYCVAHVPLKELLCCAFGKNWKRQSWN